MNYSAGLYIGVDFIDLALVEMPKAKPRLIKSVRVPLYEGQDALSLSPDDRLSEISRGIEKAIGMAGLTKRLVTFSLPQEETMVRRFKMPYVLSEERANAVKFEALRYIPFKVDDTISDYYTVKELKDIKMMETLFIAVNKQVVEKYADLLKGLKIKVEIAEIVPLALLRLLSMSDKITEDQTRVIIYVEKNQRGTIIIAEGRHPYLVREVSPTRSKEIFFENILNNLRLSIDYFKRETKQIGAGKITLCGEGDLSGLEGYLKGIITETDIEIFELKDEVTGLNDLPKKQLVALGLALAFFDKQTPRINLFSQFPQVIASKGILEYMPIFIEGGIIVGALIILQIFLGVYVGQKKANLKRIKMQIPATMGVDQTLSIEALTNMEKGLRLKRDFLENLVGEKQIFLTTKLNALGEVFPEGTWIESFQFDDEIDETRRLKIDGMVYSRAGRDEIAVANKIISNLKDSPEFTFGFDEIKGGSFQKSSAYDKTVLLFSVDCAGSPLNSAGVLSRKTGREQRGGEQIEY